MGDKTVEIEWTRLLYPERHRKNEEEFYQFYGCHPVYEGYVLLYICGGKDKYFLGETISTHRWANKEEVPRYFKPEAVTMRVGKIVSNNDNVSPKIIEEMLIFMHSPAWNAREVENFSLHCRGVIINNIGEKGDLSETMRGKDCYV